MSRIVLITMVALLSSSAVAQESDTKFVVLVDKTVGVLEAPYGIPQIFEKTFDTTGYSEIRMFIHVFAENYQNEPITSKTTIEATLFHTVSSGSWAYSKKTITSEVTSYIDGWFSEKIIGNRVRVVGFAHNLPKGPYQITVTYYLVK